jgi:hypothetical protein
MVLRKIRSAQALATRSTNVISRWICQQQSLSLVVFISMKYAYLQELLETCTLCFTNIGCYDSTVSTRNGAPHSVRKVVCSNHDYNQFVIQ